MKFPIYLLLDSRGMGGIETHVLTLARALKQSNHDVVVLFWQKYEQQHPMIAELVQHDIPYRCVEGQLASLCRLMKLHANSVLHTHGYKANIMGRLACLMTGRKCISTFHNGDMGEGKLRFYTWLDCISAGLSQNIAVSKEILSRVSSSSQLIPNFVGIPRINIHKNQRSSVAFVGRLEQVKRPDRFIDLAKLFPNQRFRLYGDGSLFDGLLLDAPKNVEFRGFVNKMSGEWADIDLLVITSETEGLPLAALEAMVNGVPVLSLAIGDLPSLIENGQDGFVVDSPYLLRDGFQRWQDLSSKEKSLMRARARQKIIESYSSDRCMAEMLAIYR